MPQNDNTIGVLPNFDDDGVIRRVSAAYPMPVQATVNVGDVSIGQVEIKDGSSATTAIVKDGNTFTTTNKALGVADANVKSDTALIVTNTTGLATETTLASVDTKAGTSNTTLSTISTNTSNTNTTVGKIANANTAYFDLSADNTAQQLKGSAGVLHGIDARNPNSYECYLQLFDATTGSVTVGTTTPLQSYFIPAQGVLTKDFINGGLNFATAITYAVTTTATGGVNPLYPVILNAQYK